MASTDYLRWSAESLKNLITNRLNEKGVFSDQIFEDSNLSTLIDIFAWTYDTLTYYLNYGASEALFSDAQVYENMNRIVKILGYNPLGFITSTVGANLGIKEGLSLTTLASEEYVIPRYSTITAGGTDQQGNEVNYCLVEDYRFIVENGITIDTDFMPTLYNGTWKVYRDVFIATGEPYETFTLNTLDLSSENRIYIAHPYIHTYVKPAGLNVFQEFTPTNNLFGDANRDSKMFELRVNENKQYTLKFGDDIYGKKLNVGDAIYVIYLQSNGKEGEIGRDIFDAASILEVRIDGFQKSFIYEKLLGESDSDNLKYISEDDMAKLAISNNESSSFVKDFETVDQIRENAPKWFRMQDRLITENDFKQYIESHYIGSYEIHDVVVHNNWHYMIEFQQWLYLNGLSKDQPTGSLNSDIRYYGYKYADAVDFNNTYIWLKSRNKEGKNVSQNTKNVIKNDVNRLKPLTSEVVILDPILVAFSPYVNHEDPNNPGQIYNPTWENDFSNFDPEFRYKIVLVRDKNTLINVSRIKQNAYKKIKDFFSLERNKLGEVVRIDELYKELVVINGVKDVNTVYYKDDGTTTVFSGLSFILWTPLIVRGLDYNVINGAYQLKSFQFPYLHDLNHLSKRIEIVSESFKVNLIEF